MGRGRIRTKIKGIGLKCDFGLMGGNENDMFDSSCQLAYERSRRELVDIFLCFWEDKTWWGFHQFLDDPSHINDLSLFLWIQLQNSCCSIRDLIYDLVLLQRACAGRGSPSDQVNRRSIVKLAIHKSHHCCQILHAGLLCIYIYIYIWFLLNWMIQSAW